MFTGDFHLLQLQVRSACDVTETISELEERLTPKTQHISCDKKNQVLIIKNSNMRTGQDSLWGQSWEHKFENIFF